MANDAKSTSPARKALHHINHGDVTLTIFPGPRVAPQRRYFGRDGKSGYASSFRVEDLGNLRTALADAEQWCEQHQAEEASA